MGKAKDTGKYPRLVPSDKFFGDTDNLKYYPVADFGSSELPELEEWEPGQEYKLEIRAKLKSVTKGEGGESRGSFEILTVKSEKSTEDTEDMLKKKKHYVKMLG